MLIRRLVSARIPAFRAARVALASLFIVLVLGVAPTPSQATRR
jgi:hypothetical protein